MLGRRIGAYEVISKLGEGGMGVVYVARHMTLGRQVVVKVLLPAFSSRRDIVTRFFNEARAATAIRNPGIVEVYDFGFLEDHLAYIIMEHLEGESLGARLSRGPLALAAVLATTRGIARALHAAHEKGIVHRDLKPDNVFLVPDEDLSSGERVKLLDFGIAKLTLDEGAPSQTQTGMLIGTPTYMAPEQCRGASSIDLRADLYALGCVVYEMLSGRPPFVTGTADILAHHMYFEPQPVSTLRPDVPPQLAQLVAALLAKDPAHRPASASVVVKTIDQLAAATPADQQALPAPQPRTVTSPSAPTTLGGGAAGGVAVTMQRQPHRYGRWVAVGSAVIVVGVAVAIFATQRASSERAEAPPTETPPHVVISPDAPSDAALVATAADAPEVSAPAVAVPDAAEGSDPLPVTKESPAARAKRLDQQGMNFLRAKKLPYAKEALRQATVLDPQALYFHHYCLSLYVDEAVINAMNACNQVARYRPPRELTEKTAKLIELIRQKAKERGVALDQTGPAKQTTQPGPRHETQAEIAERLHHEGTELLWAEQWAAATAKFRAATARLPEPKYYYKLCMSLMHEGAFGEALTACDRGMQNQPVPELKTKIVKLIGLVRAKAKEQGVSVEPIRPAP